MTGATLPPAANDAAPPRSRILCAGLGPGSPDLMSVRADRAIRGARHVAYFRKAGRPGQARRIVEGMLRAGVVDPWYTYTRALKEAKFELEAAGAVLTLDTVPVANAVAAKSRQMDAAIRDERAAGMTDRSSPPRKLHRRTPSETAEQITALAPKNTEVSPATVSLALPARAGFTIWRRAYPVIGYDRASLGELIHPRVEQLSSSERPGQRLTPAGAGQSNDRGLSW